MRSALSILVVLAACGASHKTVSTQPPPAKQDTSKPATQTGTPVNASLNGVYFNDGCATMKENPQALDLLKKACSGRDGQGCSDLAGYYMCGKGVTRDLAQAAALARQGCDYGYILSCNNVAMMVEFPDANVDPNVAFQYAQKGCNGGDTQGCNTLGLMYLQGIGTTADPVKSGKLFEELCKKQNWGACANLAMQSYLGMGMPRDLKRAAELAEGACNANMPSACNTLGGVLIELGGDENAQRAELLFTKICNQPSGGGGACDNLGQLYAHGLGSKPPDKDKAAAMFKKSCDGGFAKACTHLAELMGQ